MDSALSVLPHTHKRRVTIRFTQPGIQPPVFIVTSMTNPPWEPQEMHYLAESGQHHFHREFVDVSCGHHQYKFRLGHGLHWMVDPTVDTTIDSAGNENNCVSVDRLFHPSCYVDIETSQESAKDPEGDLNFDVKTLNARLRFNPTEEVPSDLSTDLAMGLGQITTSEQLAIVKEIQPFEDSEGGSADEDRPRDKFNSSSEETSFQGMKYLRAEQPDRCIGQKAMYLFWILLSAAGGAFLAGAWVVLGSPTGGRPV